MNDLWVALLIGSIGVMLFGLIYMETHGKWPEPMSTPAEGIGCGVAIGAVATALLAAAIFYLFTHLEFHA